jgi:hypothetical protein
MTTPAPITPETIVDTLDLRPRGRDGQPVPGRLIGFWRSQEQGGGSVWHRYVEDAHRDIAEQPGGTVNGLSRAEYAARELAGYERRARAWDALPWPGDHLDPTMPAEERDRIAALLDRVPVVARYMGSSSDRLDPKWGSNGSGERAAAGWVYPTGLSHYVRRYGLVLPAEMLEQLRAELG